MPSGAYDGITTAEDGIFGFKVRRDGDQAGDTCEGTWDVLGVVVEYN